MHAVAIVKNPLYRVLVPFALKILRHLKIFEDQNSEFLKKCFSKYSVPERRYYSMGFYSTVNLIETLTKIQCNVQKRVTISQSPQFMINTYSLVFFDIIQNETWLIRDY